MNELAGRHLHFDMPSGMAGDMFLGACLDLGVPRQLVDDMIASMGLQGVSLQARPCTRGGMAGTDVKVLTPPEDGHSHRHHADIRAQIEAAGLGAPVTALALAIFARVARAESLLHGVPVDQVAFHEVGAFDSIVDIVGAAVCLAYLSPSSVSAGAVAVGSGTVHTAHGKLPVPAPATLEILREVRAPVTDGGIDKELCTPTGAAILAEVVTSWDGAPAMRPVAVGYGAGDAELPDRPNLVRVTVGDKLARGDAAGSVVELAANIDDMNPELSSHVTSRLLEAGALDVWWTPVVMKKGRPALVLGALCRPGDEARVADIILRETSTLGVRRHEVTRAVLSRETQQVSTPPRPGRRQGRLPGIRGVSRRPGVRELRRCGPADRRTLARGLRRRCGCVARWPHDILTRMRARTVPVGRPGDDLEQATLDILACLSTTLDATRAIREALEIIVECLEYERASLIMRPEGAEHGFVAGATDDPTLAKFVVSLDDYPELRACFDRGHGRRHRRRVISRARVEAGPPLQGHGGLHGRVSAVLARACVRRPVRAHARERARAAVDPAAHLCARVGGDPRAVH